MVTAGVLIAVSTQVVAACRPLFAGAQATVPIATELRATPLSAYGGILVWSHFNSAKSRYYLRALIGGSVTDLPVPGREVPFDADIGPGRDGRPTVVYSRCAHEPMPESTFTELPIWRLARGCDLYRFRIGDQDERRLSSLSRATSSETLPSIWRERIAFTRIGEPRGRPRAVVPTLELATIGRHLRNKQLRGGSVGRFERLTPHGQVTNGPGFTALDLRDTTVTFGWSFLGHSCAPPDPNGDDPLDPPQNTEVWRVTSRSRLLLDSSCDAGGRVGPSFAGPAVTWIAESNTSPTAQQRFDASSVARPLPDFTRAIASDGRRLFVEHATDAGYTIQAVACAAR